MANADVGIAAELLEQVESLPLAKQLRVLAFARSQGRDIPPGTPGRDLAQFAGAIGVEDLQLMTAEIEQGCERIPDDAWPPA